MTNRVTVGTVADASGLAAQRGLALARMAIGAMFVWVFFENLGKGLYTAEGYADLVRIYIDKGRAPGPWKAVMESAAASAAVAAPVQAVTEIAFGLLLTVGFLTRPVALMAGIFLTSLWVSEWGTAWIWELLVPMLICAALVVGRAGRYWGIDARLARANPQSALW